MVFKSRVTVNNLFLNSLYNIFFENSTIVRMGTKYSRLISEAFFSLRFKVKIKILIGYSINTCNRLCPTNYTILIPSTYIRNAQIKNAQTYKCAVTKNVHRTW